jgi:hypothetical protein
VFPPGTTVELSDRRAAVVTQANPADPFRPYVEILTGEDAGKRFDLKTLDATEDRHALSIVRAIPPPLMVRDSNEAAAEIAPKPPIHVPDLVSAPPAPLLSVKPRLSALYSSVPREDKDEEPLPKIPSAPPPAISLPPPIESRRPSREARVEIELDRVPTIAVSPSELGKLALDHRAGFVLSMIDGMSSVETIVDASGLSQADVLEILGTLLERKVIRF